MSITTPKSLENFYFHNVGAFEDTLGVGENSLVRVPKSICDTLEGNARFGALDSVGVEIRFVTESKNINIYISCQKPKFAEMGNIQIYKGEFFIGAFTLRPGVKEIIRIPLLEDFAHSNEKLFNTKGFHSNVWRILCSNTTTVLHGVETYGVPIRKPYDYEMPSKKWLAYGSSITHSQQNGYPYITAKRLGLDMQNLGMSGGCLIEKELVDYIFNNREFDYITCELGINMRGYITPDEFERRSRYLLDKIVEKGCKAVIISVFPNGLSKEYAKNPDNIQTYNESMYNEILPRLVREYNDEKIRFVSGSEIFDEIGALRWDLLHPTEYGHAIMAFNLIPILEEFF
ncbi:MAG: SGNH/GDSL hydrolase family protein [Lachnospiraceae bacterium]